MPRKLEIKSGDKFSRLTIIEEIEKYVVPKNGQTQRKFRCSCECGKIVEATLGDIRHQKVKSCGCLKRERIIDYSTTHGLCRHPLMSIWRAMKERCYNPNCKDFKNYGGRGIKICDRWLESFTNFLQDMGERPEGTSIDRINNDGNYEISNCRWASRLDQNNNRRPRKICQEEQVSQ